MFTTIRSDYFVVEPPGRDLWCTPQSVASHTLYENADPFHLYECSGMLDTYECRYDAVSERTAKVSGSRWEPAELAGYQCGIVGNIRGPIIIR